MIRDLMASEKGQALAMVLAFMMLTLPTITTALALTSTLMIDARKKTSLVKSQYSALGSGQYALHSLVTTVATTSLPLDLNGQKVTTTTFKLDEPPGPLPFIASAQASLRLFTFITSSPSTVTTTATTTYTVTLENKDDKSTSPNAIIHELPTDFTYVSGSAVMKGPTGAVISTSTPNITGQELKFSTPSGTTLQVGESMTVEFVGQAPATAGIYCSEAYALPGGKKTSSGKSGKVTVGATTETLCQGKVASIQRSVSPSVVFGDLPTTYTYTIVIVNEGTELLKISDITDSINTGLTYKPLSVTSSPTSMGTLGNPQTNTQQGTIKWNFPGQGRELPTSTTWTIQYEATGTQARGTYTSETLTDFTAAELGTQTTFPTAPITVIDVFRIVVTDGETTYHCDVWIGADSTGTQFHVVEDCAIASA